VNETQKGTWWQLKTFVNEIQLELSTISIHVLMLTAVSTHST
jgi:hypothetical protein